MLMDHTTMIKVERRLCSGLITLPARLSLVKNTLKKMHNQSGQKHMRYCQVKLNHLVIES